MTKFLPIVIIILIFAGGLLYLFSTEEIEEDHFLEISGKDVSVQLADTPERRRVGLSEWEEISFDEGMLFIFKNSDHHSFWMKDMSFSIDIIWIDEDFRVVYYLKEVSPETYPESFTSMDPALYVLETKAGFVDRYSVQIGDEVKFDL